MNERRLPPVTQLGMVSLALMFRYLGQRRSVLVVGD